MCSNPEPAVQLMARLGVLADAIDELGADSRAGLPLGEATVRIAQIWVLLEGLDPDLDRCRQRYGDQRPA